MYNCIIIDDEEPARLLLNDYCNRIDDLNVVGIYKSPLECLTVLEKEEIDILLLDINMPSISGIDFLKTINKQPNVILTTAYREYALEGFELDVIDYILKPIEFYRFLKAINKVKLRIEKPKNPPEGNSQSIQLKSNKKIYKIHFDDILFIQSHNEYIMYHTKSNGKLMVYGTMKTLDSILPPSLFFRIHRSYIVNKNAIKYIEGNQVALENIKLPISETYKKKFIDRW